MNPCELTASITAIANAISCKSTSDELILLSSVFMQLGDTLAVIAAHRDFCEKSDSNASAV